MRDGRPVAVLGAGIAGLSAAVELRRAGVPVVVLEAAPQIAGLARSTHDPDGFWFDTGAHFITNRMAATLGISHRCLPVHAYGESVVVNGRTISYPDGLLREPRYVASALRSKAMRLKVGDDAASFFRASYGAALADEIAVPLIEKWSGRKASHLAASVGDKIPSSVVETVWLKSARRLTGRPVAIGYCATQPQRAAVWHVYPDAGTAVLCDALAAEVADAIRVSTPAERVVVEDGAVAAVRAGGEEIEVRAVISTAPVNKLSGLVGGHPAVERFDRFSFRPMIFVNLKMRGRGLLPDTVLWIPDYTERFFRITDTTDALPTNAPDGHSLWTVDYGAEIGDEVWRMDTDELARRTLEGVERIVPGAAEQCIGWHVHRTALAYPVFDRSYEADRLSLRHGTGIEGLLSVGRNAEFDHLPMEDVYWRARWAVYRWLEGQAAAA
jgi:protoporphyrinogen oxidase